MVKRRVSTSLHTTRKRRATILSSAASSSSHASSPSTESAALLSPSSVSGESSASTASKDSQSSLRPSASNSASESHAPQIPAKITTTKELTTPNNSTGTLDMSSGTVAKAIPIPKHVSVDKQTLLISPSTCEPSHDGTVILPPLSRNLSQFASGAVIPFQPADAFPVFVKGDVIIRTEIETSPKTFQLHSAVLSRHSPWFANAFAVSASKDHPKWYSFTIEEVDGKVGFVPQRTEGSMPCICHAQPQVIDGMIIKTEDTSDEVPTASAKSTAMVLAASKRTPNATAALRYYTQIIGTFYSIPPEVSSSNIGMALVQSESLTKIATELGSLHLLRSYLGNIFSQHRRALFLAIKSDPARWIQLAIPLQNQSIYTECLVHLIGAHPRWNNTWATKRTALPEDIRNLIKRKSEEVDRIRTELERDLLLTSLPYGRNNLPLDPTDRGQTETWITVQVFRDLLAQRIYKLNSTHATLSRGTLFRGLLTGTLPFLETENVRKICQGTMPSHWNELHEDLELLKGHAGKLVAELAANELMIDPDANGVGYLTCAKVKDEDVPWLATSQSSS